MKLLSVILFFSLLCLAAYTECYGRNPLQDLLKAQRIHSRNKQASFYNTDEDIEVYVEPQQGRKKADKIDCLPGQPPVNFDQYSGYVTVDPGRALFYYFAEAAEYSSTKPLVLWLNGGPGCSSLGYGAMTELGPFRVNPDGKTLWLNKYGWNSVSNVIFLESPTGVGFSYSNKSSDYVTGDSKTARDTYTFLVNWLERFSEYKGQKFYIAGENYAGHYVPQLAQLILQQNNKKHTSAFINLKGIAIGNAYIDYEDTFVGTFEHLWTSALISDQTHKGIKWNCNFSTSNISLTSLCRYLLNKAVDEAGDIDMYNIYAPLCHSSSTATPSISNFDPCSDNYVSAYLNNPEVQKQLHANITRSLHGPWKLCNDFVSDNWRESPDTVLPVIKKLMASDIRVWIYSGDTDGIIPVTTTRYSIPKLNTDIQSDWHPWYCQNEVAGYVVEYENMIFVTIRGAGRAVSSYQPERALVLFSSFLRGKPPPDSN